MTTIAIIGTAGRDKTKPMTLALWQWMIRNVREHVPQGSHVVSGGAAWADHLAVSLMLTGWANELTLHFPAPFDQRNLRFIGPDKSAASAANYYHSVFSKTIDRDTLGQIAEVLYNPSTHYTEEPERADYKGMFARNMKVAKADKMIAYTFGPGDVPADGGTLDTWNKCQGEKLHISLPYLP
jgi:hypothetical protein